MVFGAGSCRKEPDGAFVVEARDRPDHYFSLRIPAAGGPVAANRSYTTFVLSVVDGGNRFSAGSGSVQLEDELRGGKVSATDGKGATATGSFTCGASASGG